MTMKCQYDNEKTPNTPDSDAVVSRLLSVLSGPAMLCKPLDSGFPEHLRHVLRRPERV